MNKNLLKKEGCFLGEADFYNMGIYAGTRKFYAHGEDIYTVEKHTNAFACTGKNDTYKIAGKEEVAKMNQHFFEDNFGMDEEIYNKMVKCFA